MKNTQFKAKKNKFVDLRGLNVKKNYSSFWMDDKWDNASKFSGMSTLTTSNNNIVKLVKLSNYRRAIINFVKIVTKQDIPVLWAGNTSYTDGKSITISTDIKDNNFDVTVGLALHEASHIILSDFELLKSLQEGTNEAYKAFMDRIGIAVDYDGHDFSIDRHKWIGIVKQLLNWIEDRRIDNFIFSTSPGYKAYYHKLYDYYWNSEDIHKGFFSKDFSDPTVTDSWFFHIVNSLNPQFNSKALPRLDEIVNLIDVRNISRLQNTAEAFELTLQVAEIIHSQIKLAKEEQSKPQSGDGESTNNVSDGSATTEPSNGSGNGEGDIEDEQTNLTSQEINAIEKAIKKQKDFLNNNLNKKQATNKLQRDLDAVSKQSIDLQTVGGEEGVPSCTCLIYDLTNGSAVASLIELNSLVTELRSKMYALSFRDPLYDVLRKQCDEVQEQIKGIGLGDILHPSHEVSYVTAYQKGIEMGGLLGKRLQLHNESRERVDNRLRSGKIDNKRLASAGYGIESVFKQIHVDKYKKANLHISLDGSGSMSGSKWRSVIQMTAAICKAANYAQNINIQVSIRITTNDTPAIINAYDSRKNNLNQLKTFFEAFSPNTMTPEGLCYEAMVKKNMFISSTSEVDSYLLNISDGDPCCNNYSGQKAFRHTKRWVNKIKSVYNISVLSFWLQSSYGSDKDLDAAALLEQYQKLLNDFQSSLNGRNFREMYGADASVVDPSSAMMIAKALNKKFLTA